MVSKKYSFMIPAIILLFFISCTIQQNNNLNLSDFQLNAASTVTYEAESFSKSGYSNESNSSASDGKVVKLSGTSGNITKNFSGETSSYDISIVYIDQAGDAAYFSLSIAGTVIGSWNGDSSSSTDLFVTKTFSNVSVANGAQIKLSGTKSGTELAKYDVITFTPSGTSASASSTAISSSAVLSSSSKISSAVASSSILSSSSIVSSLISSSAAVSSFSSKAGSSSSSSKSSSSKSSSTASVTYSYSSMSYLPITSNDKANIIVAQDGTGNFTTIQAAINSVSSDNSSWVIIAVKNGTYNEHIFIGKSYIALVGESRENTKIEYALNRDDWYKANGSSNNGSGVMDIGVTPGSPTTSITVTDIFIGNMTISNIYNSKDKYTHVIRGESACNRIYTVNCNIWCIGKDTHALWNGTSGMYYQANCSYKGYVDAVCPRGWSYDVESDFVECYGASPIWHEGVSGSGQKFVIRNARVLPLTTNEFDLFNGQGASTFYMMDCYFSSKVKSQGSGTAYFYNCTGESGNQSWFANNLSSVSQSQVTAAWTFNNTWDPENTAPQALPYASIPQPWNKAYDVSNSVQLKWIKARNAVSYNVYFGKTSSPSLVINTTSNSYTPGTLDKGSTYYWRVDTVTADGIATGILWTFTVSSN